MRTSPYVGFRRDSGVPEPFRSPVTPTYDSHGTVYSACMGPFRTMRAAKFTAETHPNPHIQTVSDAERIAALYANEDDR